MINKKVRLYYEFSKQEYYGLITVSTDLTRDCVYDAAKVYSETVGGETPEEVLSEGEPELVTREYAFWKLANSKYGRDITFNEFMKEFFECENTALLVDGSLV
ncbi:hypothetical protein [Paraliobacillus ryukyuensis]|uniref:hypothetical protein n=1 Tax=Paraliobacillus ryukyuensis TaxID=200904 RepID=UPI0009A6C5FE|nr:hypothetical protein [Paraliobacillus ryukyuensis]